MQLRWPVGMKCDLHARHTGHPLHRLQDLARRMPIPPAGWTAQHQAETIAPIRVRIGPNSVTIEADEGVDPAGPIKVGPLVGEAQMRLDDTAADGFEVQ